MFKIKQQLRRLYAVTAISSLQIAGASWVALLAARGFSLTEIGFAEGVFHFVSFLFEVPSGVIADVFGRKRSMVASQCMFAAASAAMLLSRSMAGVCLAMALSALGYNFASGSREALAYESLKMCGREEAYQQFAVNDLTLWRVGSALATLCAGFALWLGPRAAYGADLALALAGLLPALALREPEREVIAGSAAVRIRRAVRESAVFILHSPKVLRLMLCNAAVGAVATMLLYLLQARLPALGLPAGWLGPALFVLSLSGTLGAQAARFAEGLGFRSLELLCAGGVFAGAMLAAAPSLPVAFAGGFLAGMLDDLLDVRSDVVLNEMVPSAQRATLVSVSSLTFSLVMLAAAPLMGALFGAL